MAHLDLGTYLLDDALSLENVPSTKHPAGKTYKVPSPSATFGLQIQRVLQAWTSDRDGAPTPEETADLLGMVTDDDGKPMDFHAKLLGPAYAEMLADGVTQEGLSRIGNVVMAYYGMGEAFAQAILGSSGEAPARPNRAARRGTAKKTAGGRSKKASGGSVTRTRQPVSRGSSTPRTGSVRPRKAG